MTQTFADIELSDGGVIEAPDEAGTIRRRDVFGNLEEAFEPTDRDYQRLAQYFPGYTPPSTDDEDETNP